MTISAGGSDPLVSILIPSYKPQHFEFALTSALGQAYENKEIIVSDDCPTEEIAEICARYPQVTYSRNPDSRDPNRQPNTNLCRLTRLARGEYIKYLLDDDLMQPLCVRRMVDAFNADPRIKLVFSARDRIDADNRLLNKDRSIKIEGETRRFAGDMLRKHCITNVVNVIGEFSTVMFRKTDVCPDGGDPFYTNYHGDRIVGLTDIATFLQLCETGDAVYIADPLSLFRIHATANSSNVTSPVVVAGLAEWATFTRHACRDPAFSTDERRAAIVGARNRIGRWAQRFPHLQSDLDRLEAIAAQIGA